MLEGARVLVPPIAIVSYKSFSSIVQYPIQSNPIQSDKMLLLQNSIRTHPSISPSFFERRTTPPQKLFPCLDLDRRPKKAPVRTAKTWTRAALFETPVLWAGRVAIFYALLKAGLAGSPANPIFSDFENEEAENQGFSKWFNQWRQDPEREAADRRKLVSKWHPTTKGTLRRNYRVPSKYEGQRLLRAIASLLSNDDHFRDATSHKGCQIRRETSHGESVCCNNVRALFDELPTPHLVVEITPFPVGSLTENDYAKAEKLEGVLRSSPSV